MKQASPSQRHIKWSALAYVAALVAKCLLRRVEPHASVRDHYREMLRNEPGNVAGAREVHLLLVTGVAILRLLLMGVEAVLGPRSRFVFEAIFNLFDYPLTVGIMAVGVLAIKAEFLRRRSGVFIDRLSWREDLVVLGVSVELIWGGMLLFAWAS